MSALRRFWGLIEDNTTPPFRIFAAGALVMCAVMAWGIHA